MNTPRMMLLASALALLGACASGPTTTDRLLAAEQRYEQLRSTPRIEEAAAAPFSDASAAIRRARSASAEGAERAQVDHLAELAMLRAELAQAVLDRRMAERRIEEAEGERREILLAARERDLREAEAARQRERARASRAQADALDERLEELSARQSERGTIVTLDGLLFETGRATLAEGAERQIERLGQALSENPGRTLMVEGFTDSTGSDASNLALSQRRADAVKLELIRAGVAPDRIVAKGFGSAYPVAPNDTRAGRQQNRRVEVIISDEGGAVAERTGENGQSIRILR